MEGDAGASRLNPADGTDQTSPQVTGEDSPESETGTGEPGWADESGRVDDQSTAAIGGGAESRLDRRWRMGVCASLVVLSLATITGGALALRYHRLSQAASRDSAAAVATAKECVVATQVPDAGDLNAAVQKIYECAGGDFRTQANIYAEAYVQGYQVAGAHVQISELRAAAERTNRDGSVDVLVAFRAKVDNAEVQGREFGYRLRAQMLPEDGRYRIAKLDQVAK